MVIDTNRLLALLAILAVGCGPAGSDDAGSGSAGPTLVDDAALASDPSGENWRAYGRTSDEKRFSPLTQVNDSNVGSLGVDWFVELYTDRGLVSTPLVVDGVMYFVGSMNIVRAVDATSGDLLWEYDPLVREHARRLQAGWDHNRGIAFYKGRVYAGTWDGRLKAIDAETGQEVWSVMTVDPESPEYITGAPKVFKDKVLIGNGGTENGPTRGYVTAYDAATGAQAWRFWVVPGNPANGFENDAMEMAAETWTGEWWVHGGGGNAWHGFTYDAELDQLYIGTGNGSPWNQKVRSPGGGDNLFLSSVVALDPDTGEYLWHYQTAPGETWDYNSNMDIVLADLEIDGRDRKVIMHAPKSGFFYVIDRTDGELISAEPFVKTTWASHIDMETGRPVEVPGARYEDGTQTVAPGPAGGHSWHAMSFNPETGLAYYPAIHISTDFSDDAYDLTTWRSIPWNGGTAVDWTVGGSTRDDGVGSTLQAWDPVRQELAWEVPMPGTFSPGTLTTAGNLVFQGRLDGTLAAYRADTGDLLWEFPLGLGISAPPITYAVDGRQYVALLVGWGGAFAGLGGRAAADLGWSYGAQTRMLVAFSLEGTAELSPFMEPTIPTPVEADFDVNSQLATMGGQIYGVCARCHGPGLISAGMAPDLRASHLVQSAEAFAGVVRDGNRAVGGMPAYPDFNDLWIEALRHYIRQQAELALAGVEVATPAASGNQ
jgi:quinohemoprotein ethanol dehydrogenase